MRFEMKKDHCFIQAETPQDVAYLERLFDVDLDGSLETLHILAGGAGHSILLHGRVKPQEEE